MLQGVVKRNTKRAEYNIWSAARFEWDTTDYTVFTGADQVNVTLRNDDLGEFESVAVKATCDKCGDKFTVLYVAYGQVYTCENCNHTHDPITKEQADDAGLNWIV